MYLKSFEAFTEVEYNFLLNNDKTYLKPFFKNKRDVDLLNISKYDISNFKFKEISMDKWRIIPDSDFINLIYKEYDKNLFIDFSLSNLPYINDYNRIDFDGIPVELRGYNLGYRLYKLIIKKFKFITSIAGVNTTHIWVELIKDNDFYAGVNKKYSIIIDKDVDDNKLLNIIKIVEPLKLNYDKSLIERLNKLGYDESDTKFF